MKMKQIEQQNKGKMTRQTSLINSSTKRNKLLERYETADKFMLAFNPSVQMKICENKELCFFGKYPTLIDLKVGYAGRVDIAWLVPEIADLSEFCGCKGKLTNSQMEQCACIIAHNYGYLKVSEFMLFFYLFKSGKYGKFYGSVDPMVITCALRDFIKDRSEAIFHYESEQRKKKEQREHEEHLKYLEDCEKKGIKPYSLSKTLLLSSSKPKENKGYSKAQIKSYAELLATNKSNYTQDILEKFTDWFKKMFHLAPKEWLQKNT